MNNLYILPASTSHELTQTFAESPVVRIERIISRGHASPDGFWFDQDESEWVVVLNGMFFIHQGEESGFVEEIRVVPRQLPSGHYCQNG